MRFQAGASPKDWLGWITQNSAYNSSEQPLLAYQRTWHIYVELAGTAAARAHPTTATSTGGTVTTSG